MTATLTSDHITIDDDDVRLAAAMTPSTGDTLILRGADGSEVRLPDRIQHLLMATLASVAEHGEVTIGRLPEELTSTVAAELLSVSRPTLMKWVGDGRITGFKVGSHTRFKREDVFRLREERARARRAAFQELREDGGDWD